MAKEPTILVLVGLPASGKTTRAKKLQEEEGFLRWNRDDIRLMLYGHRRDRNGTNFSREIERDLVYPLRDAFILEATSKGYSVVIDDTNLSKTGNEMLAEKFSQNGILRFDTSFLSVGVEKCLKRNRLRQDPVPEEVIRDMHEKFLADPYEPMSWKQFYSQFPGLFRGLEKDREGRYIHPDTKRPLYIVGLRESARVVGF